MTAKKENKVARIVTDEIIKLMEQGVCPWNRPWFANDIPKNLKTKTEYKGFNKLMLLSMKMANQYESNYWLTFKQSKTLGGTIKKGSKATPIIYFNKTYLIQFSDESKSWKSEKEKKQILKKDPYATIEKESLLLRYYNVFNLDQIENIESPKENKQTIENIEKLDNIEKNWTDKPKINFGGNKACYIPSKDEICLPPKENFKGTAEFYTTKWHELGHSTGARKRLARKEVLNANIFGNEDYSKEELTAEIFASSMLALAGINKTINNNAAYIQNWLEQLRNDENMLIHAAARAQKAVDYVLSFSNEK